MKIALLNFSHTSQCVGGVETRYSLLERAFKAAGHDVTLLATSFISEKEIQRCFLDTDLAISDSAIGKASKCPMITIFGNPWQRVLDSLRPRELVNCNIPEILETENKWHSIHSTFKVAVSDFMASELRQQRIIVDKVIPNSADTHFFQPRSTPKIPTALWVGSVATIKNYVQVQDLMRLWPKRYPEYPLVWRTVLKDKRGENELNRLQMREEYTRASVVISTSHAEGCSNSLLEAVASNIPIIATRSGLFWNWWDDRLGARVNDPSNTQEFLFAIKDVLQNKQKYDPRQVAFDRKIDYDSWAGKWQKLVTDVFDLSLKSS